MARYKKLHAPAGADEANFAGKRYRVDNNGEVEVPEEAVDSLVLVGGFTITPELIPPSGSFAVVANRDGATSCSWGGNVYEADDNGCFSIPGDALADLSSHGFYVVEKPEASVATKAPKLKIPT
jgi:hypothetical protein